MTAVRKLREEINQTPDRWESAADSLEKQISETQAAIAKRLESQKQTAIQAVERLKQVLDRAREMPAETRQRVVEEIDQLRDQLSQGQIEGREAALTQKQKIDRAKQVLDERLESISEDVHPDFVQAVKDYVRVQLDLETELELAAQRFAYEQAEKRARFESRKQEMLKNIDQFRKMLNERRAAGAQQGRPFAQEMNAAFDQIRQTFQHLAD